MSQGQLTGLPFTDPPRVSSKDLEKILAISDDDYDVEKFQVSEEEVAEMMRWLQPEIGLGGSPSPSLSQDTTFVTINGNEESCGPSFSGTASTVMASIVGGPSDRALLLWPWPVSSVEDGSHWPASEWVTAAEEAWLASVLDGAAPFELEEGLV